MEIIKFKADEELPEEYLQQLNKKFDLWMNREECDDILQYETLYLAVENSTVAGFQTVNNSNECLVIEVLSEFRGQYVSFSLIQQSDSIRPYELSNDNPSFWERVANEFE